MKKGIYFKNLIFAIGLITHLGIKCADFEPMAFDRLQSKQEITTQQTSDNFNEAKSKKTYENKVNEHKVLGKELRDKILLEKRQTDQKIMQLQQEAKSGKINQETFDEIKQKYYDQIEKFSKKSEQLFLNHYGDNDSVQKDAAQNINAQNPLSKIHSEDQFKLNVDQQNLLKKEQSFFAKFWAKLKRMFGIS